MATTSVTTIDDLDDFTLEAIFAKCRDPLTRRAISHVCARWRAIMGAHHINWIWALYRSMDLRHHEMFAQIFSVGLAKISHVAYANICQYCDAIWNRAMNIDDTFFVRYMMREYMKTFRANKYDHSDAVEHDQFHLNKSGRTIWPLNQMRIICDEMAHYETQNIIWDINDLREFIIDLSNRAIDMTIIDKLCVNHSVEWISFQMERAGDTFARDDIDTFAECILRELILHYIVKHNLHADKPDDCQSIREVMLMRKHKGIEFMSRQRTIERIVHAHKHPIRVMGSELMRMQIRQTYRASILPLSRDARIKQIRASSDMFLDVDFAQDRGAVDIMRVIRDMYLYSDANLDYIEPIALYDFLAMFPDAPDGNGEILSYCYTIAFVHWRIDDILDGRWSKDNSREKVVERVRKLFEGTVYVDRALRRCELIDEREGTQDVFRNGLAKLAPFMDDNSMYAVLDAIFMNYIILAYADEMAIITLQYLREIDEERIIHWRFCKALRKLIRSYKK